jgi:hypothetical protein
MTALIPAALINYETSNASNWADALTQDARSLAWMVTKRLDSHKMVGTKRTMSFSSSIVTKPAHTETMSPVSGRFFLSSSDLTNLHG